MADPTQAPEPGPLSVDEILDQITATKLLAKGVEAHLATLQDRLTERLEAGEIDHAFSHNDWSFSYSLGKRTWSYPPAVKAAETSLKAAKKAAEADGTATATTGAPFWTVRPPKS